MHQLDTGTHSQTILMAIFPGEPALTSCPGWFTFSSYS